MCLVTRWHCISESVHPTLTFGLSQKSRNKVRVQEALDTMDRDMMANKLMIAAVEGMCMVRCKIGPHGMEGSCYPHKHMHKIVEYF